MGGVRVNFEVLHEVLRVMMFMMFLMFLREKGWFIP